MMRHKHGIVVRLVVITFICMIVLNFYVNVWSPPTSVRVALDSDSLSAHDGHSEPLYVWPSLKRRRGNVVSDVNVTIKNVLARPVTTPLYHVTPAYMEHPVVWPNLSHFDDDRIQTQIKYVPKRTNESYKNGGLKKIFLIHGLKHWDMKPGSQSFADQQCPVSTCALTDNPSDATSADAILFRHYPTRLQLSRPAHQKWILYMLESPYATPLLQSFPNIFNWTATYRRDSEIVTPYEKFVKYQNRSNGSPVSKDLDRNYAAGKTKKVAWFVSNCRAFNQRLEYARELSKYIEVDIYGACGNKRCPRSNQAECLRMLDRDYKFYLAFENANCRDYVTEKFFVTGLQHDVIPIVMGAAPEDYERVAPHYSYIHVDHYGNPKVLAEYLHTLDASDDLYNEYFQWKGTGSFINTYFWCRLCSMLHDETRDASNYGNLEEWWRGKDVCIGKDRWRQHPRSEPYISDYYRQKLS